MRWNDIQHTCKKNWERMWDFDMKTWRHHLQELIILKVIYNAGCCELGSSASGQGTIERCCKLHVFIKCRGFWAPTIFSRRTYPTEWRNYWRSTEPEGPLSYSHKSNQHTQTILPSDQFKFCSPAYAHVFKAASVISIFCLKRHISLHFPFPASIRNKHTNASSRLRPMRGEKRDLKLMITK